MNFGLTLLHRCLCIGTKHEHMVFVPVAHEQTLAYDELEMAQAGCLGTVCVSRSRGTLRLQSLTLGHPGLKVILEKDVCE